MTRPMTPDERELAALLGRCRFTPGHPDKRFAAWVAHQATLPEAALTEAQAEYLARMRLRYRRQVHGAERVAMKARGFARVGNTARLLDRVGLVERRPEFAPDAYAPEWAIAVASCTALPASARRVSIERALQDEPYRLALIAAVAAAVPATRSLADELTLAAPRVDGAPEPLVSLIREGTP